MGGFAVSVCDVCFGERLGEGGVHGVFLSAAGVCGLRRRRGCSWCRTGHPVVAPTFESVRPFRRGGRTQALCAGSLTGRQTTVAVPRRYSHCMKGRPPKLSRARALRVWSSSADAVRSFAILAYTAIVGP